MNRAMFSGVAGLKSHQTKMDVIGNNIANVNTYGYKSQRAVFADMMYQTLRGASAGGANRGGTNPSSVGYGSALAGIQTQMTQSSMQSTGFGLDVAITGEGFLQVMDPDGNIFYTKAGLLDYDSNGYLTDINGNFVLGASGADAKPDKQKIKLDNIGSVDTKKPTSNVKINGVDYTVTASNATKYGNVNIGVTSSDDLPAGLPAVANISSTGAIQVTLNAYEKFDSLEKVNKVINAAIKEANGGKEHEGGTFTFSATKDLFGTPGSAGTFLGSASAEKASLKQQPGFFGGCLEIGDITVDPEHPFTGEKGIQFNTTAEANTDPQAYTISATVGGVEYFIKGVKGSTNYPIKLETANKKGSIELKEAPGREGDMGAATLIEEAKATGSTPGVSGSTSVANSFVAKYFLGGAKVSAVSQEFPYDKVMGFETSKVQADGSYDLKITVGGKEYTATEAVKPGSTVTFKTSNSQDGSITMTFPDKETMFGNLGVQATDPVKTLETKLQGSQSWQDYKTVSAKSPTKFQLTGEEIARGNFGIQPGEFKGKGVEDGFFGGIMEFMKTSLDFSGSGTVLPKDFTAKYTAEKNGKKAFWTVSCMVGNSNYSAEIDEDTAASSILLKGPKDDYIQMSNPGFKAMNACHASQNPTEKLEDNAVIQSMNGDGELTVTPATKSRDLGWMTMPFSLKGGTEGGAVKLDELASIAIGADGTVTVNHSEKGTVVAGRVALANFGNPRGLQLSGNNYYIATANSGEPKLCAPGSDGTGALKNSALEMSNVDLSAEFADMITTQRGFQANSRIITVADTMLEELINLKR